MKDDNEIILTIGQNIKKARKAKGLTQSEVEVDANLAESDLSRIEKGLVNITTTKLVRIAITLGVSLNDLYKTK